MLVPRCPPGLEVTALTELAPAYARAGASELMVELDYRDGLRPALARAEALARALCLS